MCYFNCIYKLQLKKRFQILQVLEIFEIWICQIFEFDGHQKWPELAASNKQRTMEVLLILLDIVIG